MKNRIGRWMLAVALACSAGVAVWTPSDVLAWGPLSREGALKKIGSTLLEDRRQGYIRLADVGTMDDVPLLLSALTDDEDLIRGVAEQAIWGIWMRANDSTADPMFQVALDLTHQNKLAEAEAKFDQLLMLVPEFSEGWHRRGEVKVMGDRWREAAQDFSRALELNPYHFGALEGLGHCSMRTGRNGEAVGYFERALELNPNLEGVFEALKRARKAAENERT